MINRYLGGSLSDVSGHVAVRHAVVPYDPASGALAPWLEALPVGGMVNSYHGQGIAPGDLAPLLRAVLRSEDGLIEAAEHRLLPWAGIMWHPEREPALTGADRALLTTLFCEP